MNQYFFALGTNHTLSKIDIVNLLVKKGVEFEIVEASEEILLVAAKEELAVNSLMKELGSAAKIGKIFGVYQESEWPEKFLKEISGGELAKEFGGEKFGISVYGAGGKFKELNRVFGRVREIAEKIKGVREIRETGRVLSTVAVDKNRLLENGFELVLCVGSKGIYVGKTLAIQDYESYSLRDYGRPMRNVKSGMIPPKIAKMMINLAGKEKEGLFLDPFCGSGTILQELILLGYKNLMGSDLEKKAVQETRANLDWLFKTYRDIKKEDYKIELFESEVRNLSTKIPPKVVDAIVTEPYLGSVRRKFLKPEQIKKEISGLEELYLAAFGEFKKILKSGGAVVIIFPVFRWRGQFFYLEILEKIKSLGFRKEDFLKKEIKGKEKLRLVITKRGSVVFFRPGQLVSREIFCFSIV